VVVASLLCAALILAPLYADAQAAPPLGQVIQADHARLGTGAVVSGATLFDGDKLETGPTGSLRARLNSSQLFLLADSGAAVRRSGTGTSVALDRGTAIFSTASPATFELVASGAQIRARTEQPTLGQVTLLGANEFIVTCENGELEVIVGDETRTVAAASSYRAVVGEIAEQGPQGTGAGPQRSGTVASGKRKTLLLWSLVGAAFIGGITYALKRAFHRVSDP
jgi:hypothetical protein